LSRALIGLWAVSFGLAGYGAAPPPRPPITGLSHIALYASDATESEKYYTHDLGGIKGPDPENAGGARYYFSATQFVEVLPLPAGPSSINRLDHLALVTPDAEAMRRYLASRRILVPVHISEGSDQSRWFDVTDPEGHRIEFFEPGAQPPVIPVNALSSRILHAGFIVHDADREDDFFIKVLGFRVYWQGGLTPDQALWIWRQLPDSRDWLEYMIAGTDVTQDTAGAMNHFALGVRNVEASYTSLWNAERIPEHHKNPMLGHSAKWEFDLFDPDGTRTEIMEFHAVGKACCSPVTAPEPEE
jgi:catechol 2,3-dioxygenase-like lactoylglutathione lyase family enzyme